MNASIESKKLYGAVEVSVGIRENELLLLLAAAAAAAAAVLVLVLVVVGSWRRHLLIDLFLFLTLFLLYGTMERYT